MSHGKTSVCPVGDQKIVSDGEQECPSQTVFLSAEGQWGESNGFVNQQLMEERAECTDEWAATDVGDQGQRRAVGMEARPSGLTKKERGYFLTERKEEDADTGKLSNEAYLHLLSPSPRRRRVLLRML